MDFSLPGLPHHQLQLLAVKIQVVKQRAFHGGEMMKKKGFKMI